MREKLDKAINSFCEHIPYAKIGEYSNNALDDKRLIEVAYQSYISEIEATKTNFEDGLKQWHNDVAEKDIRACAESCYNFILHIKGILINLDKLGHLNK